MLIEDKASGTQLIQDLVAEGMQVVTPYQPKIEKVLRMNSATAMIANGFVHIPQQTHWLNEFLHELAIFPNGRHSDQVDSVSQTLDWIKDRSDGFGLLELCKQFQTGERPLPHYLQSKNSLYSNLSLREQKARQHIENRKAFFDELERIRRLRPYR